MLVGEMVVAYTADWSNLKSGSEQVQSQMGNVAKSVESASNSMNDNLGGATQQGGFNLLGFASNIGQSVFWLKNLGQTAIQTASALLAPNAQVEQTTVAFSTLLHSTKAAKDEMAALNKFAAVTPFKTQDIDDAAAKMLAFGFTTKDTIPDITAIGDALSALGKGTPAMLGSIVDIFGKIKAEGKLSGGVMMELSRNGIPAWNMLSEVMGKPVPELQKMVSKGLIPASMAISDLTKGMEKTFGGGMANQAQTFNGLMSTLQSNAKNAWVAFSDPLFQAAKSGLSAIGNILASDKFQNFAATVGTRISGAFKTLGDVLDPIISKMGGLFNFNGGGNLTQGIEDGFKRLQPTIQAVGDWFNKSVIPALRDAMPGFQKLGDVLSNVVAPAIEHIIKGRIDALVSIFKIFAPIVGEMIPPLIRFAGMIADGLGQAIAFVMPYVVSMTDAINTFAVEIAERVAPIVQQWIDNLTAAIKEFAPFWNAIWPGLAITLKGVWNFIAGVVQIAWSIVSGIIKIGLDLLSGNWKRAWSDMGTMLQGIWNGFQRMTQGGSDIILGIVRAVFGGLTYWLTKPFNDAWGEIQGIWNNIAGVIKNVQNFVGGNQGGIPAYANGIDFHPGGLALVGDDGPELINLPRGASVTPLHGGRGGSSSTFGTGNGNQGGSQTIILQVDGREMARALGSHMVSEIRLQTGVIR